MDRVEHQVEQLGLARDVAVQRHRADAETLGDPPHRRRVEPSASASAIAAATICSTVRPGFGPRSPRSLAAPEELEADLEVALDIGLTSLTAYAVLVMAYSVPDLAIEAIGLRKRYGSTVASRRLDLAVPEGTVCGLLGPNGAGKTTAVRIFATLLRLDAGARRWPASTCRAAARGAVPDRADRPARRGRRRSSPGARTSRCSGACSTSRRGPRGGARTSCSSASGWPMRRAGRPRRTRAGCGGGSTSRPASSSRRACCSSTSRRPARTRATATRSGTSCARSWPRARPCC